MCDPQRNGLGSGASAVQWDDAVGSKAGPAVWCGTAAVAEPQERVLPRQPDKAADSPSVRGHDDGTAWPKLSVIGGGYAGTDGNHIVRRMERYTDV